MARTFLVVTAALVVLIGSMRLQSKADPPTIPPVSDNETSIEVGETDSNADQLLTGRNATTTADADEPNSEEPLSESFVLTGQITDDTGAPVDDATIKLRARQHFKILEIKTDAFGRFAVKAIERADEYQITIDSVWCVGISYWDEQPVVRLTPMGSIERDFQLPRACRLRVRVIDEKGKPIRRVGLMAASLASDRSRAPEQVYTDSEGWATLGGLVASDTEYIVGTTHDNYGFEKLIVKLNDPSKVVQRAIVLKRGRTIAGKAICSDGKPPAGWRISAMPGWWHFGRYPMGQVITEDGSFTLKHIIAGRYDVRISIPSGDGGSSSRLVLKHAELWDQKLLSVRLDHPSPASLVFITGRVEHVGDLETDGYWIFANAIEGETRSGFFVPSGTTEFKIGPVPKGMYRLKIEDVDVEAKDLRIAAPAKGVVFKVAAKERPHLTGAVINAADGKPVTNFRVRIIKLRTLKGPSFVEDTNWREFTGDQGRFDVVVNGPGIYELLVAAEGFAWTRTDPINTEEDSDKSLTLKLTEGVSLSGTVVDEEGNPVDGATVIPHSKAAGTMPRGVGQFTTNDGAVQSEIGRFMLTHLALGKQTIRVTHPEYCFAIANDIDVSSTDAKPVKIVLTRGGTVRGRVYDGKGQPEPNVTLYFQDRHSYAFQDRHGYAGRFATAITDAEGAYEVQHLPGQLCYVHREDVWQSNGIVRHCILPENGRVHTLDFGGKTKLTGRLLVNGTPLAQGRVLMAGENPNVGIYKAYAMTDSDGSLTFRGLTPGKRTLYHALPGRRNDWGRVRAIRVVSDGAALGDIDHVTGRLTVNLQPADAASSPGFRLRLQDYDPIWTHGNSVGMLVPRQRQNGPFVFEQLPVGKYELISDESGHLQTRQLIEMTADSLEQELTLSRPVGTASLRGHVDDRIRGRGRRKSLKLWSTDQQLLGHIIPGDDGEYSLGNIPAGEYVVREKATRNAPVLMEVSIRESENRKMDITPNLISPAETRVGFLVVRVFTNDGVPIPCDVELEGPAARITPHSSKDGRVSFVASPGTYTLLATFPGFETVRREVDLKPVNAEGRPQAGYSVRIQLAASLP